MESLPNCLRLMEGRTFLPVLAGQGHGLLPRRPCQLWHQISLSEGNSPQGALLELPETDPTGSSGDAGLGPQAEPRVKQASAIGKKGDDRREASGTPPASPGLSLQSPRLWDGRIRWFSCWHHYRATWTWGGQGTGHPSSPRPRPGALPSSIRAGRDARPFVSSAREPPSPPRPVPLAPERHRRDDHRAGITAAAPPLPPPL
ncbi:unnamed protein product [Rangifer tarandus platyrhynchus]|uniref:Uncharacterized protein n=2 Tax=Rangifer tarandus platyrhynchus TaxID=3082113 RepID=A0ACB0F772_RANTA|nr:unnamed protein product [Rangifer tarandus platyrhynchus]CAI9708348.1 unnamed protein product [Rangifer tarandus platyrhynchus]